MLTPAFAEMLDFARKPLNSICTDFIPILKDSQNEKWLLTKMEKWNIYFIKREAHCWAEVTKSSYPIHMCKPN